MIEHIVGIDPDSEAHGVAFYRNGELVRLQRMALMDLFDWLMGIGNETVLFSIEDVCANKFVYTRNQQKTRAANAKVGMAIGRCQQAQVELMRVLDYLGIKYELHAPQGGNWAKNKATFELVTKWKERSNEDTRSAAFFGMLAVKGQPGG